MGRKPARQDSTDFDLAEMDPYAITPRERQIIDAAIASDRLMSDQRLDEIVDMKDAERLLRMARRHVLLAKRLLASITQRQVSVPRDLIVALRAIVTDPAST